MICKKTLPEIPLDQVTGNAGYAQVSRRDYYLNGKAGRTDGIGTASDALSTAEAIQAPART
ncbi:hypothetical protein GCM10017322_30340 [Paracoccus aerius]|nr:hypothetical protein GCM10017322_30340 [Paracoccus aerius]